MLVERHPVESFALPGGLHRVEPAECVEPFLSELFLSLFDRRSVETFAGPPVHGELNLAGPSLWHVEQHLVVTSVAPAETHRAGPAGFGELTLAELFPLIDGLRPVGTFAVLALQNRVVLAARVEPILDELCFARVGLPEREASQLT